ncbi:MAG TPA: AzlC family ABC transporter permease [Gaiellaceae bacterium]|nr:AzlC family ABC transporter permease [Gaiellaceae bacterium]
MTTSRSYRDGARAVAALTPAALSFGAAFGVLAESAGMGTFAPIVMSATTFAGAAQFAAASVLDEGGSVIAAVAAAVLLNARYGAVSIAVASAFRGARLRRLLESQLIVDESWAVAQVGGGRIDRRLLVGAGLLLFPFWVGGTALGVLFGDVLGDPEQLGLDAAFPALFLALLAGQLASRRAVFAALAGAAIALVLLPLTPPGVPVIAASAVCLAGVRPR